MRCVLRLIGLWLVLTTMAGAQSTTVTGTVKDAAGNPYPNSPVTANFFNPDTKVANWNGFPMTATTWSTNADAFGNFTLVLPDLNFIAPAVGTYYTFKACANTVAVMGGGSGYGGGGAGTTGTALPSPSGQPTNPCGLLTTLACPASGCITGSTISITTALTAVMPPNPVVTQPAALGGNNAFTGNNTFSGTSTFNAAVSLLGANSLSSLNNILYMDGSVYPFNDAGLTGVITAANLSGFTTIIIPSSLTVSTSHSITGANVSIQCQNGATLTYTSTGRIRLQGAGDGIGGSRDDGCIFTGPGTGTVGALQPATMEASNQFFVGNTVTTFGATGGSGELEALGGSNLEVAFNTFDNNADLDIFVNNATASTTMQNIRLHDNYAGEIIVHVSAVSNAQINHVIESNNILHNGQNSKVEFCLETGNFSGIPPLSGTLVSDVNLSNNQCYSTSNGTNGGFSIALATNVNETGDLYDAQGFTYTVASIEHVLITKGTVTGITAIEGTGGNGFTCDRCSQMVFNGISVDGFTTAGTGYGFHLVASATYSPISNNNTISNVIVNFPASGTGHGIWVQCNATSAQCSNNVFAANQVKGSGTAGSQCITIENDTGTTDSNQFSDNQLFNCQFAYNIGATSTNTHINSFGRQSGITTEFEGTGTVANAPVTGQCTMNGTTGCAAQSFGFTFAAVPKCFGTWTGGGALAGRLSVPSTTTTVTPASTTAADTAVINYGCSIGAGN